MKISYNEIEALCKKAFSGAGYSVGDYEDAALMVAWAELHGLSGLQLLETALPRLAKTPEKPFEICCQDDIFTIVDANEHSVLTCGAVIIDVTAAKSTRRGTAALRLLNIRDRKLLLGYLSKYALQGHHISAIWQADGKVGYIANYTAGHELPAICRYDTDEAFMRFPKARSMTILFSQHTAFEFAEDSTCATLALETPADSLRLFEENTYRSGIEVSDTLWHTLKTMAADNLVPASEQSRRGAG